MNRTPDEIVGPRRFYPSMTTAAYLRVSTGQQSIDQQHDAIAAAGITPDRVFTDTSSGRAGSNRRSGWTECLGWLRDGDQVVEDGRADSPLEVAGG